MDGWGFQNLEYECEGNEVVKMWCTVCHDFYLSESQQSTFHYILVYLRKMKCNVEKHFKDSVAHKNAVLRLASERNETPEGNQKSIVTCVRNINLELRGQLIMKFQLARFIAVRGKSFKLYQYFVHFEKNVHHVALGSGFLTDAACREMP